MLKSIILQDWNQFESIKIDFHPKVTILTGANGSGKSTIIRLIARQIGWDYAEVAKVYKNTFLAGLNLLKRNNTWFGTTSDILKDYPSDSDDEYSINMGEMKSETGLFKFYVPKEVYSASYSIETRYLDTKSNELTYYIPFDAIRGVNITSHRQPYSYVKVDAIPLHFEDTHNIYSEYIESMKYRTLNYNHSVKHISPVHHMKKYLISLAIFGEGNSSVKSNDKFTDKFNGFVEILKVILPEHLGFEKLVIENGEVIMKTGSGDFLIDAVSGGIGALIDLAWQIYMYDEKEKDFTVVIDEIENHLHPSMQREILPKLIKAFPMAQFIISTHSPFIVNSVKECSVYALKYNLAKKVESIKLDFVNQKKDAFEILKDVLGVPVTMPIWIEKELDEIVGKFDSKELRLESYNLLKEYLEAKDLKDYLPEMLNRFEV